MAPFGVVEMGVMAMSENGDLRFFSPALSNMGLWHRYFCHNPKFDNAKTRQIATTPISATRCDSPPNFGLP